MKRLRVVGKIDEETWMVLSGTTFTTENGEEIQMDIDPDTGYVYFTDLVGNDVEVNDEELLKMVKEEIEEYGLTVVVENGGENGEK